MSAPYANGEDWATYFQEYRAGLDAKVAEKARRARLVLENGKFRCTVPGHLIEISALTGQAQAFAKIMDEPGSWKVVAQESSTHHDPTVYIEDDKSKNENEPKKYLAGDIRYPAHDEIHQSVEAAAGRDGKLVAYVGAHYSQKIQAGDKKPRPMSFQWAKVYIYGVGWDTYQSATEFNEWQYVMGLKPRPKPKKKPEPEDLLMAPLTNGEWNA